VRRTGGPPGRRTGDNGRVRELHRGLLLLVLVSSASSPLRLSAQLVHEPFPLHLVFTGDINLGTRTLPDGLPPDSGRGLFAGVDSLLRGDLVVGNFEGVLSDSGESAKCAPKATRCYAFATPSWLAPRLREAGFTHLNLANNHANDYGLDARHATEAVLRDLGLVPYGPLDQVAITPVMRDGKYMLVGVVGFATYPHTYNLLDLAGSVAILSEVRPLVDVLLVTFHGGKEGAEAVRTPAVAEFLAGEPRGNLRRWARAVIDAGADAVIGHGPHVLRGVEFYRGRPVFYSLGNFVTWRGFNLEGPLGLTTALALDLDAAGGFVGARMPALRQRPDSGTGPDPARRATALLRRITRLDFPRTGAHFADDGTVTAP
jgi:Bacterial capsule synthesis protein PGA_cap